MSRKKIVELDEGLKFEAIGGHPLTDFNVGGWRPLRYVRLSNGSFGRLIVEQLHEHSDGRREWKKMRRSIWQ